MESKLLPIRLQILALGAISVMASGCSDNNDGPNPATKIKAGDAVAFTTEVSTMSRSVYDPSDMYQILWGGDFADEISIYSQEAMVGTPRTDDADAIVKDDLHLAHYLVTDAEDAAPHAFITPLKEEETMLWSNHEDPHTFYAVFPKSRNIGMDKNGNIHMAYHTNQQCYKLAYDGNGHYTTQPDMRNAYMVAKVKTSAQALNEKGEHVLLYFDPLMTTLDITVTAGQFEVGTGIIQPVTVTGVSVTMPKYLEGGNFVYNMGAEGTTANTHESAWTLNNVKDDGEESVFVSVVDDRNGDSKHYLDLFEGESLNLMAFLPPMEDVDKYMIRVHTTTGSDFVKTVKASDLSRTYVSKRSRINITLPNIYPDGGAYIGEAGSEAKQGTNWMSRISENTSFDKFSIPGYECDKNTTAATIKSLLDKGVRAFDISTYSSLHSAKYRIEMDDETSSAFNDFVKNNPGETLIVWYKRSDLYHLNTPDGWETPSSVNNIVRGKINAFELYTINNHFHASGTLNAIFNSDNHDISLTGDWGCHYLKDGHNKANFDILCPTDGNNELTQTGVTGIVMVPNADKAYDNGTYTYSDLLIQGIIDCNFKFNLRK